MPSLVQELSDVSWGLLRSCFSCVSVEDYCIYEWIGERNAAHTIFIARFVFCVAPEEEKKKLTYTLTLVF